MKTFSVTRGILLAALFFLTGCGESSVFEGLGDEGTQKARYAAAQRALDKADCNRAVELFTTLHMENLQNVDHRLDLAAGYLCKAGFSVQGLLGIVADFSKDEEGTKGTLLQKITAQAATVIPDAETWKASVCASKDLLGDLADDGKPEWPCASKKIDRNIVVFNNDPDAGYILTIVNLADATLAIADALHTFGGIARCDKTALANGCQITTAELRSIADSLVAAAQSASAAGSGDKLFQTADNLVFNADGNGDKALNEGEIINYLLAQKIVKNCNLDAQQNKYICT